MGKESTIAEILGTVKKHLLDLGLQVQRRGEWDLSLPVAIVDARKSKAKGSATRFHVSPIGTIGNVLRISVTCDHPLMRQLFELYQDRGDEEALNFMMNGDDAEEFSELFSEYQKERKSGQLTWGASDASAFVFKSKECFGDREIAVAILHTDQNGQDELTTCGVPFSF
jgi:hypothetical protein